MKYKEEGLVIGVWHLLTLYGIALVGVLPWAFVYAYFRVYASQTLSPPLPPWWPWVFLPLGVISGARLWHVCEKRWYGHRH